MTLLCNAVYEHVFALHDMNARTLPRMTALHMGQWRRLAAQSVQTTRWPQGMKTIETSLSMQILQVLSSWSCRSCSSGLRSDRTFSLSETCVLGVLCLSTVSEGTNHPHVRGMNDTHYQKIKRQVHKFKVCHYLLIHKSFQILGGAITKHIYKRENQEDGKECKLSNVFKTYFNLMLLMAN